jgi:hypothetical protein
MINPIDLLKKSIILCVTAMPGLQKLLVLFFIGVFHSTGQLGIFINDIFIIQIFTYFTTINWANIVMVDTHKYGSAYKNNFFARIINNSIFYCIPACIFLIILFRFNWIQDIKGSILYLISFSLYQLLRHYLLTQHKYWQLFFFDSMVILISFILCYAAIFISEYLLSLLALPYFTLFLYFYINEKIPVVILPKIHNKFSISLHVRAIQNAFSNFSTASIPLFIAPMSFRILSAEYTSVIGVVNSITNIMLLVTRSVSLHTIPILSKIYLANKNIREEYRRYKMFICKILIAILGVCILLFCAIIIFNKNHPGILLNLPYIHIICILMFISVIASQFSLPASNLAIIIRRESTLLLVNITSMIIFIIIFGVAYKVFSDGLLLIIYYQILQILISIYRYIHMEISLKKYGI